MPAIFDKIFQSLSFALLLAIFAGGIWFCSKPWRKAQDLTAERDRIMRKISARQAEIDTMRENQRRFNTDREFVEMLARKNHRLFPGEVVFVFGK